MAQPPPRLLLCFDFDGTLIHHGGEPEFHPGLREMLIDLRRRGVVWVINTGRSLSQTLEGLGQHQVFLTPDYIIARECEIYRPGFFRAWSDYGSWNKKARRAHAHFLSQHHRFLAQVQDFVSNRPNADFLTGDLGEVGIVAEDDSELDEILRTVETFRADQAEIGYHRNGRYLRFSHADYSKGTALQELGRLLQVPTDRIFAGGDNFNDLPMLDASVAGKIACPGNALPPVKEHVRAQGGFVSDLPASEGMLEALRAFYYKATA